MQYTPLVLATYMYTTNSEHVAFQHSVQQIHHSSGAGLSCSVSNIFPASPQRNKKKFLLKSVQRQAICLPPQPDVAGLARPRHSVQTADEAVCAHRDTHTK